MVTWTGNLGVTRLYGGCILLTIFATVIRLPGDKNHVLHLALPDSAGGTAVALLCLSFSFAVHSCENQQCLTTVFKKY